MAANQNQPVPQWKIILVELMLLFLFPLGVLLMFLWMRWPLWVKLVLSVGAIPLVIFIYSFVLTIVINPFDIMRKARDAARFSEFADVQEMMMAAQKQSITTNWLCNGQTPPCEGKSIDSGASQLDGRGWVKVDFTKLGISVPVHNPKYPPNGLFVDPINSNEYFYRYCSDGKNWEIDTKLDSTGFADTNTDKARVDGGDDINFFEVGTDLKLCK